MRLIDDSGECDFLDNRKQKYQLLSTSGDARHDDQFEHD
jgi:hypothetical protein